MIPITLTTNAAAVVRRLTAYPPKMAAAVARALDLENELTVGAIVADNLSFPAGTTKTPEHGLRVQSSRLRRSVRPAQAQIMPWGIYSAIGSNVIYAGPHERGFRSTVTVRAHTRRNPHADVFAQGGAMFDRQTGKISRRKTTKLIATGITTVRQHKMKMNIRARHYISSKIEERAPIYREKISEAILSSWEGEGL